MTGELTRYDDLAPLHIWCKLKMKMCFPKIPELLQRFGPVSPLVNAVVLPGLLFWARLPGNFTEKNPAPLASVSKLGKLPKTHLL